MGLLQRKLYFSKDLELDTVISSPEPKALG